MKSHPHVAIAGATGAVGTELLQCLEKRGFPVGEISLLASARSAGKTLKFQGKDVVVKELTKDAFVGADIALFSAGGGTALEYAPAAAAAGAIVVDNSSAFRMDPEVPLVIPEVNPEAAQGEIPKGIIANPNCTTIVSLMALAPLHRAFGVKQLLASSYQAVSGSGVAGTRELETQIAALAAGERIVTDCYPHQIAYNAIPQVDVFTENGYTKEEMKMVNETRKILGLSESEISVGCTCVRVPVMRSHAVSVTASFREAVTVEAAREAIAAADGIQVIDDPTAGRYPTPLDSTLKDDCMVGRIRKDLVLENGLSFWVVGDQVLKGAALNTVQIAELLLK